MRKIAVIDDFMTPAHHLKIDDIARKTGFDVSYFSNEDALRGHETEFEILYGHCAPDILKASRNLKWFCCSYAGVDPYQKEEVFPSPETLLTNSSGAYGITIAEHILMVTLMLLRRMPEFQSIVAQHRWQQTLPMRSICGSTITVLGTGDIGTNFARRARAMGAKAIWGVRRSKKAADPAFDEIYAHDEIDTLLPQTDILVLALPSTPDTRGILSKERIALLPPHAYVVNVGRGSAIDQEALMEALNAERLAGAALDVMVPEPLPADHPLWNTKNLILTPHCSGNMSLGITCDLDVDMFCEDLQNYAAGRSLAHLVNRKLGY
ncbi:MAG: D-2-hydroxyacid dehydrogenase [Clostridiales bacterium]|nr:D-2-hydroxyacid dehydrogenase [Clostridiales bacterium]